MNSSWLPAEPARERDAPSFVAEFLDRWHSARAATQTGTYRVLDVGTGNARIPIALTVGGLEIEIIAVDRAPGTLRRAAERISRVSLQGRVRLVLADAQALPFSDHSFDAVISNGLVHHVADQAALLREMLRVLRPGGLFFSRDSLRQPDAAAIERALARRTARKGHNVAGSARSSAPLAMSEVSALLEKIGLPADWLQQSGRQHWVVCGTLQSRLI